MIIDIDTNTGVVVLEDVDDLKAFAVRTDAVDATAAAATLGAAATVADEGHLWIDIDWVRARALESAPASDTWAEDFASMCAYAESKGWVDDTGSSLRAHIDAR